ncbi:MAG: N-acetyl-gamma-glutamyl-phosphate reductase [Pseudomonadota bacterium]
MIKVGIAGATGYTGAELVKLIAGHPGAELVSVMTRSYQGQSMGDIFPAMRNRVTITCEPLDISSLCRRADCVFLALPHKVSMEHAPELIKSNVKVVDLSADFRFKEPAVYESAYQEHSAKDLLAEAVYGLSEIYRDAIRSTSLVGNPGCYPTSFLLPMIPLVREKLVSLSGIVSDSKSGVSGAGRSVSLTTHFCEVNESFKPYKVGNHRHVPEMEAILSEAAGQPATITFVPHLLPVTRGMLSTIYAQATPGTTADHVRQALEQQYGRDPFVRILPRDTFPDIAHVRGTNFCDIGFWFDNTTGRVILVSAIDNLLKGAAGQAVQNMNIMFGIPEETGLDIIQGAL